MVTYLIIKGSVDLKNLNHVIFVTRRLKAFPIRFAVARHRLSSTGVEPFKCEMCENAFSLRSALISHK